MGEVVKKGKLTMALEEYMAITDKRCKKKKEIAKNKVLAILERKVCPRDVKYGSIKYTNSYHILYWFLYRFDKKGLPILRELWEEREAQIQKRYDDSVRYDENTIDITRPLEVGDILLDEDEFREWVVVSVKSNWEATIRKRKGHKEITIHSNCGKMWNEEDDEEHGENYEPLYFGSMFKDKNFTL